MKTQDIRNMALALKAVEEATKKKLDPVGKEDGDIDNDGDKDKSDSYLHNRRKAVSSAIKGKGTKETVTMEEVEELDELKKSTLGSYVKKATGSAIGLGAITTAQAMSSKGKADPDDKRQLRNRMTGVSRATDKLTKEEVELDEISKKTLGQYVKAASSDAARKTSEKDSVDTNYSKHSFQDRLGYKKELGKKINQRRVGISKAVDRLTKEEVELDEVSSSTLSNYSVKAASQGMKRVSGQWMADQKVRKKEGKSSVANVAAGSRTQKEETSWPIFARIQEKVNQTKGATKPESMEDRFTASDKKMVAGHGGIGKKTPEDFVDDNEIDQNDPLFKATNVKAAPKRHNDQTIGDKSMPKPK